MAVNAKKSCNKSAALALLIDKLSTT